MLKRFGKTLAHLLGRAQPDPAPSPPAPAPTMGTAPAVPPALDANPAPSPTPPTTAPVPIPSATPLPAETALPPVADAAAAADSTPAFTAAAPSSAPETTPAIPPAAADVPTVASATPAVAAGSADEPAAASTASAREVDADEDDDDDDDTAAEDDTDASDTDEEEDEEDESDDEDDSSRRQRRAEADEAGGRADRIFFGEEVFGASQRHRGATLARDRLARFGLPAIASEQELADWLGIPLGRLRWYTQDRPADTTWHYVRSTVPKRGGGERVILAPKRALKDLQRKVLAAIVAPVPTAAPAHGFVRGHSIVTNAQQHVGRAALLKFDLKDFFPSITFARVRGLFIALGYSFPVASTLALLCTEHERQPFDRDGTRYHISIGPRYLVQGAPTSPGLANLVAWRLDRRLAGLAAKHGLTYTRYADDLTFSGADLDALKDLRVAIQRIIRDERFTVNNAKTRLAGRSTRQIVTGLVVNDAVAVPRAQRRKLRAILHNARTSGLAAQNREQHPSFRAHLRGQIAHIHAANPEHAARLRASLERLTDGDAR